MGRCFLAGSMLLVGLSACEESAPSPSRDAGGTDLGVEDAGADGGAPDMGPEDGGAPDGGGCMPEGDALAASMDRALTIDTDGPDTACALPTAPSALFHFVAPAAGWYRVETEGSTDTLIELREACSDVRLACNDQYGGDDARLWFEAEADQAFEIVLAAVSDGGPTTIRVLADDPTRPRIDALRYFRGDRGYAIDIDTVETDVAGALLSPGPPGLLPLTVAAGGFELVGTSTLPERISVRLVSHGGFEGEAIEATASVPVESSGACDPTGARTVCQPGLRCGFWDEPAVCVEAGAPEITVAELYVNPERESVGVYVEGRDAQANIGLVEVDLLDAEGVPLRPTILTRLERIEGSAAGQAGYASGALDPGLRVAQADVRLVDTGDERSAPLRATVRSPALGLEGDGCDLYGALVGCPAGTVCSLETGTPGDPTRCLPPVLDCPEGVAIHALTLTSTGSLDLGEEDFSAPGSPTTPASCGGGRAGVRVLQLSSSLDGFVDIEMVRGTDFVDPLLWVRTHCGEADPSLELGCFDDPPHGSSLLPTGRFRIGPGAPVFIGVDRHPGVVELQDFLLRIHLRGIDE